MVGACQLRIRYKFTKRLADPVVHIVKKKKYIKAYKEAPDCTSTNIQHQITLKQANTDSIYQINSITNIQVSNIKLIFKYSSEN